MNLIELVQYWLSVTPDQGSPIDRFRDALTSELCKTKTTRAHSYRKADAIIEGILANKGCDMSQPLIKAAALKCGVQPTLACIAKYLRS